MHGCYNYRSIYGTPELARDGFKHLTANVALQLGLGVIRCEDSSQQRALKHAKRARRDGFESVVDRSTKGEVRGPHAFERRRPGYDAGAGRAISKARDEPSARLPHSLQAEAMELFQVGLQLNSSRWSRCSATP